MGSNPTFQKRQKELARKERQKAKAERKAQRKLEKQAAPELSQGESLTEDAPVESPAALDQSQT